MVAALISLRELFGQRNIRCAMAFSFAFVALSCMTGSNAHAGQIMREVWFPDGEISWKIAGRAASESEPNDGSTVNDDIEGNLLSGVREALDYYSERTPLQFTEDQENGELTFRAAWGPFNFAFGGMTEGYRNPNANKLVLIDTRPPVRNGQIVDFNSVRNITMHEMGHVLGFTHEFQRIDRRENGVSVCPTCGLDPFNYDRPDARNVRLTSPYDDNSQFAAGYKGVDPLPRFPSGALLSAHDVNSIYRAYAGPLKRNRTGDEQFGRATAAGDFDGDGIADIAVASLEVIGQDDTDLVALVYFFKGVATARNEPATRSYMPWFASQGLTTVPRNNSSINLVAGDLRESPNGGLTIVPGTDGIDELVVGIPGANSGLGRVDILTVNVPNRFRPNDMPFGGKGILHREALVPQNLLPTVQNARYRFGASIEVGHVSSLGNNDLVVGVPGYPNSQVSSSRTEARRVSSKGRVLVFPNGTPENLVSVVPPFGGPVGLNNGGPANSSQPTPTDFGRSITLVRGFHAVEGSEIRLDALLVGSPGDSRNRGATYLYDRARSATGSPAIPELINRHAASDELGSRYGTEIEAVTIPEGNGNSTEYYVLTSAPRYDILTSSGSVDSGKVWLDRIVPTGGRIPIASVVHRGAKGGERFGSSLATNVGPLRKPNQVPRDNLVVAIGAARGANSSGSQTGTVTIWTPFSEGIAGGAVGFKEVIHGRNTNSRFGLSLSAIRQNRSGGGFIVGSHQAQKLFTYPDGRPIPIQKPVSGAVEVFLRTSSVRNWSAWNRSLTLATTGDLRPDN